MAAAFRPPGGRVPRGGGSRLAGRRAAQRSSISISSCPCAGRLVPPQSGHGFAGSAASNTVPHAAQIRGVARWTISTSSSRHGAPGRGGRGATRRTCRGHRGRRGRAAGRRGSRGRVRATSPPRLGQARPRACDSLSPPTGDRRDAGSGLRNRHLPPAWSQHSARTISTARGSAAATSGVSSRPGAISAGWMATIETRSGSDPVSRAAARRSPTPT